MGGIEGVCARSACLFVVMRAAMLSGHIGQKDKGYVF